MANSSRRSIGDVLQSRGITFSQWANIQPLPYDANHLNTISLTAFNKVMHKTYDQNKKSDAYNIIPNTQRLEDIKALIENTTTYDKDNLPFDVLQTSLATWKHTVRKDYIVTTDEGVIFHYPMDGKEMPVVLVKAGVYRKMARKELEHLVEQQRITGSAPTQAPLTPLEETYNNFVAAHVADPQHHLSRDDTYSCLSRSISSSLTKAMTMDLIFACPHCQKRSLLCSVAGKKNDNKKRSRTTSPLAEGSGSSKKRRISPAALIEPPQEQFNSLPGIERQGPVVPLVNQYPIDNNPVGPLPLLDSSKEFDLESETFLHSPFMINTMGNEFHGQFPLVDSEYLDSSKVGDSTSHLQNFCFDSNFEQYPVEGSELNNIPWNFDAFEIPSSNYSIPSAIFGSANSYDNTVGDQHINDLGTFDQQQAIHVQSATPSAQDPARNNDDFNYEVWLANALQDAPMTDVEYHGYLNSIGLSETDSPRNITAEETAPVNMTMGDPLNSGFNTLVRRQELSELIYLKLPQQLIELQILEHEQTPSPSTDMQIESNVDDNGWPVDDVETERMFDDNWAKNESEESTEEPSTDDQSVLNNESSDEDLSPHYTDYLFDDADHAA